MLGGWSKSKFSGEPKVFGAALKGGRGEQQDSFRSRWLAGEQAWLLVLADGMGGHASGGLASTIAVDGFTAAFPTLRESGASLRQALFGALEDVNTRIAKAQQARPQVAGMGTTLVGAYLYPQGLAWISVGDSPMWLYRTGELRRLNEDHSLRETLGPEAGGLANMLQSALVGGAIPLIDCHSEPMKLRDDDLILVASDGLLTLPEREIARLVDENVKEPQHLTQILLQAVEERAKPYQDNCTLLIAAAPRQGWFSKLQFYSGLRHQRRPR